MDASREARLWGLTKTDPQAVIAELQSEVASPGADPTALYLQGVAYYKLGDWTSARRRLGRAVAGRSTYAHAWYYLALTAEQESDRGGAVEALRTAAASNPSAKLEPLIQSKLAQLDPGYRSLPAPQPAAVVAKAQPQHDPRGIYTDVTAQWVSLPALVKGFVAIVATVVIVFLVYVGWSLFGPGQGIDQHEERRQEIEEMQQEVCDEAARNGVDLPGC